MHTLGALDIGVRLAVVLLFWSAHENPWLFAGRMRGAPKGCNWLLQKGLRWDGWPPAHILDCVWAGLGIWNLERSRSRWSKWATWRINDSSQVSRAWEPLHSFFPLPGNDECGTAALKQLDILTGHSECPGPPGRYHQPCFWLPHDAPFTQMWPPLK